MMDEDTDSRTAAFERKRPHGDPESDIRGVTTSGQSTPRKRSKRQDKAGGQELGDSVPVGGNFSTSTIPMGDADDSRSDMSSDSDADKLGGVSPSQGEHKTGGAAPSINWNLGSKARIRTTLGASRPVNPTNPRVSMSLAAPTSQAEAKDSLVRTNTGSEPRQIGTLTINEDGRPLVALDPSIPEIPGIKSGALTPNVKLLNPPPGTVHMSRLDNVNDFALKHTGTDGEPSGSEDAVVLNLQSEHESGEITGGDVDHREGEGYKARVETGQLDIEEPRTATEKKKKKKKTKQREPADEGVSSTNKVVVKNLPFELDESELRESFAAYNPTIVSIARRAVSRARLEKMSMEPETRIGRGFGFVTFETEDIQQRAVNEMNDTMIKDRKISVKVAINRSSNKVLDSEAGGPSQENIVALDHLQTDSVANYSLSDPTTVAALDGMDVDVIDNEPVEKRRPQTLADLAPDDLKVQLKYFYITKVLREVDMASAVRCLVCMQEGHMAESCGTLLCTHCGVYRDHFSNQCPSTQKCHRCRERGHEQENCPHKLVRLAARVLECDLCSRKGHTEAKCELLWRTSGKPWESDMAQQSIRRSCYECGANRHLGNDCPTRKPRKPMGSSTWSLGKNTLGSDDSKDGTAIKGRAQQNSLVDLDASEDDQANFYRRRIPQPARSGQIRIANTNSSRYQDNSWAPTHGPQQDYRTDGRRDDSHRDPRDYGSNAYRPNQRRRSLSPQPRYPVQVAPRGGYDGSHDQQQPLPRGLPAGRAGKGGKGHHGKKNTYKPMPSSARSAWSKHRT